MLLFNKFKELKEKFNINDNVLGKYNIVNIGGEYVYIENQKELIKLSSEVISFKLKNGYVQVKGADLSIAELSQTFVMIKGKITIIEVL